MKTMVIAEIGINHGGGMKAARRLVRAAAEAGADVVKTQAYDVTRLYALPEPPITDHLRLCQLSLEEHIVLRDLAHELGVEYLSTPFDPESLRMLVEDVGVGRVKIGSGCLTDVRLLRAAWATGLPVILSTGMASHEQVLMADNYLPPWDRMALMQCTSSYPATPKDANLRWIAKVASWGHFAVGYSHHAPGIALPIAAVAMGATVIEAHLTLDKGAEGPDHAASLDPAEFRQMVSAIRQVETAMGDGIKRVMPSELDTVPKARKVLCAAVDVAEGTVWTEDNLTCLRAPGQWAVLPGEPNHCAGVEAHMYFQALGQTANADYTAREPLDGWEVVE